MKFANDSRLLSIIVVDKCRDGRQVHKTSLHGGSIGTLSWLWQETLENAGKRNGSTDQDLGREVVKPSRQGIGLNHGIAILEFFGIPQQGTELKQQHNVRYVRVRPYHCSRATHIVYCKYDTNEQTYLDRRTQFTMTGPINHGL